MVYEYNSSGSTLASYVLGGNQLISQTRGSTTNYFLQDGQNSTRALTNSTTGAVTDTYSYTAFSESFATTGTTVNPYRYTGQQLDTALGYMTCGRDTGRIRILINTDTFLGEGIRVLVIASASDLALTFAHSPVKDPAQFQER